MKKIFAAAAAIIGLSALVATAQMGSGQGGNMGSGQGGGMMGGGWGMNSGWLILVVIVVLVILGVVVMTNRK